MKSIFTSLYWALASIGKASQAANYARQGDYEAAKAIMMAD